MINNILHILICFMCDFFNLCVGSIFRDSPYYAAAFVKEVRKAARSLNISSERGRVVPESGRTYSGNIR